MQEEKKNSANFPAFNVALGKTLIAAAWVDGELNQQEMACLKKIILQLPGITFDDWRKLKIYLAYPLTKPEQVKVAERFAEQVYLKHHRQNAWESMLAVIRADGGVNLEEKKFAEEIDLALSDNAESFLRTLKFYFFKHSIFNQEAWPEEQTGREKFIHEFFDNPVYFLFRKAILNKDISVVQSKPELQKICLFSALLAWMAKVDDKINFPELKQIRAILKKTCGLSDEVAKCIQEVSFSIDANDLELSEVVTSLREVTHRYERNDLFHALSRLLVIDGEVTDEELESLRTIALYLEISQEVWIDAIKEIFAKSGRHQ